ncbi:hypothetical protein PG996_008399 [Apiospora saccharicola]|uniref:Uncharacterized protein n=1 Tax=Apiospora saccharicola TaxID=335842 RepID=A0ABR1UXT1_9PEZI
MSSLSRIGWPTSRKEDDHPYHTAQLRQDEEKSPSSMSSIQETFGKMPSVFSLSRKLPWATGRKGASLPYYMPRKPMEPFSASPYYDEGPEPVFTSTHAKEKWDEESQRREMQVRNRRYLIKEYWWRFLDAAVYCFRRVDLLNSDPSFPMARLENDPMMRYWMVIFAIVFFFFCLSIYWWTPPVHNLYSLDRFLF